MNFGTWQLAAFCDNLFNSRTVTNYALGQTDGTTRRSKTPTHSGRERPV